MALGYYVAKSSNPRIWIIKGLLTGFGALISISVFFLLTELQDTSATGPNILPEMIAKSPLYWILAVATVASACYVTKPRSIHSVPISSSWARYAGKRHGRVLVVGSPSSRDPPRWLGSLLQQRHLLFVIHRLPSNQLLC
jgi:hypothetical protein